jgi:hypothetical protein
VRTGLSDQKDLAHFDKTGMTEKKRYNYISLEQRGQIVAMLLHSVRQDGSFPHGDLKKISDAFDVDRKTVWRIWKKAKLAREQGLVNYEEISSRKKNCGRRTIHFPDLVKSAVKGTPLLQRRSMRKLAKALGVSKSLVWGWKKDGILRSNTNAIKPMLTEENKVKRVLFALEWLDSEDKSKYQDMMDIIHLDEKWFYISRDGERFLLSEDEPAPYRTVAHKSHIKKVMFLCAVARPRWDPVRNGWFDGKLGMWPVGSVEAAKRKSKNREKGAPVWQNKNMTQDVYRGLLENELIPAIMTSWPRGQKTIRIQQDGAKAHIPENDAWFTESLDELKSAVGLEATLYTQPANSPDVNVLDLGFFRAIQSANDEVSKDELQLIEHVKKAFDNYPKEKINHVWLTLQSCYNSIIDANGGNDYKIPHMGKERLERLGQLPAVLDVTNHAAVMLGE